MKVMIRAPLVPGKLSYCFKMETSVSCYEFRTALDDVSLNVDHCLKYGTLVLICSRYMRDKKR